MRRRGMSGHTAMLVLRVLPFRTHATLEQVVVWFWSATTYVLGMVDVFTRLKGELGCGGDVVLTRSAG